MVQPPIFGEALVQKATGATRAVAFDHNLRAKQRKEVRANFPWLFPLFQDVFVGDIPSDYLT